MLRQNHLGGSLGQIFTGVCQLSDQKRITVVIMGSSSRSMDSHTTILFCLSASWSTLWSTEQPLTLATRWNLGFLTQTPWGNWRSPDPRICIVSYPQFQDSVLSPVWSLISQPQTVTGPQPAREREYNKKLAIPFPTTRLDHTLREISVWRPDK